MPQKSPPEKMNILNKYLFTRLDVYFTLVIKIVPCN